MYAILVNSLPVKGATRPLGSQAKPANAIPPEYGEAANEILNQAAQNGAVAGGVTEVPPIGKIQGQVPVAQGNPQYVLGAMPIEQQRLIAAQQASQIGAMPDMPKGAAMGQAGPTSPPSFYIPNKPVLTEQHIKRIETVIDFANKGKVDLLWAQSGLSKNYYYFKQYGFNGVNLYNVLNINTINSAAAALSPVGAAGFTMAGDLLSLNLFKFLTFVVMLN